MPYPRPRRPDVSIVTRMRILARSRSLPWLRIGAGEFRWLLAAYTTMVALHLVTTALFLFNTASGQAAGLGRLPTDDAWIHMVYARSFAEHFAFYYNPGTLEAGMTSPLWVVLLGLSYKVLSPTGIGLVATAKVLGMALAMGSSIIALNLVTRITNNKMLGGLAGGIITLDPVYSFAKVSGVEASLFGFLALGVATAFYNHRLTLAGLLLALAVAARPEGFVLVILAVVALLLQRLGARDDLGSVRTEDFHRLALLAGPPLLMALVIALYNAFINGTWYPNSYLVKHVALGLFNFANLKNLVQGYILQTSFFGGYGFVATVPLLVLAAVQCFRQANIMAIPLVLFPPALVYALSVAIPVDPAPWTFLNRRYLDPSLPFLAAGVVVGLNYAWTLQRRWYTRRQPRWLGPAVAPGLVALLVMPFLWMVFAWPRLTSEYSWNNRNVNEVNVAIGRWVDTNLPREAVVGAADSGAIRFFGNRQVVDLLGLNTHTTIGKPIFESAREHDVDYLIVFRNVYFDSWPWGVAIFSLKAQRNTILGAAEMVVYQAVWDREIAYADKSRPQSVDVASFRLLDSFDVGNQISEEAHIYSLTKPGATVERVFYADEQVVIQDEGRTSIGAEQFTVRSEVGQPLIIVKRYDAAVGGSANVYVNDVFVGQWNLAQRRFFFGEDTFRVAPRMITDNTTELRFEYIRQPGTTLNSFHYWIYTVDGR